MNQPTFSGGPLGWIPTTTGPLGWSPTYLSAGITLSLVAYLWWTNYLWWTIISGYLSMCPPTILDVYVSIIRDVSLHSVAKINICVSDPHF